MELQELRDEGYEVTSEDGRVSVTGPPLTDELRQAITCNKQNLLRELEDELWDWAVEQWQEHEDRIPQITEALKDIHYGEPSDMKRRMVASPLGYRPTISQFQKAEWRVFIEMKEAHSREWNALHGWVSYET